METQHLIDLFLGALSALLMIIWGLLIKDLNSVKEKLDKHMVKTDEDVLNLIDRVHEIDKNSIERTEFIDFRKELFLKLDVLMEKINNKQDRKD